MSESLRDTRSRDDEGPSAAARYVDSLTVWILYRNHTGVIRWRKIMPLASTLRFHSTPWHPDNQWIIDVVDRDKDCCRTFSMKDILEWRTTAPEIKVNHED
jgi:hypothetical protein